MDAIVLGELGAAAVLRTRFNDAAQGLHPRPRDRRRDSRVGRRSTQQCEFGQPCETFVSSIHVDITMAAVEPAYGIVNLGKDLRQSQVGAGPRPRELLFKLLNPGP